MIQKAMAKINYMKCKTMCEKCMCVVCNCHLEHNNDYIKGLFSKIEPTIQNINSIAEFNKIVMNYKKMIKLENNGK
jgi:hypothetical protein